MPKDVATLERYLTSKNKEARLKALKLILRHPDATPIQLVHCLCSEDNRNFEFLKIFELGAAMRESWSRLRGVTDDRVYEYLSSYYATDRVKNVALVVHILELLCTRKALDLIAELKRSAPATSRPLFDRAYDNIFEKVVQKGN